jgi:predicted DNA-binding protein
MGRQSVTNELVTLRTRVSKTTAGRLDRLAARNERSVAAELRLAIDRHLTEATSTKKDGRK